MTQEEKSAIELEVRRLLEKIESERHDATLDTLAKHRDFLMSNTRWVVRGFFGLLILFSGALIWITGDQVDDQVIRYFVERDI